MPERKIAETENFRNRQNEENGKGSRDETGNVSGRSKGENRNYQRRRGVGISDGFHWCGVSDDAGGSKADV